MSEVPEGFVPLQRTSPFSELLGPVYAKGSGRDLSLGLRVERKHTNMRGQAHGGVLAALADMALGYVLSSEGDPQRGFITASLTTDYAGSAKIGDWIYTRTDVQRRGRRLAFANCYVHVGEQRIVRASGVFIAIESNHR